VKFFQEFALFELETGAQKQIKAGEAIDTDIVPEAQVNAAESRSSKRQCAASPGSPGAVEAFFRFCNARALYRPKLALVSRRSATDQKPSGSVNRVVGTIEHSEGHQ
jgi:hypothetical protein